MLKPNENKADFPESLKNEKTNRLNENLRKKPGWIFGEIILISILPVFLLIKGSKLMNPLLILGSLLVIWFLINFSLKLRNSSWNELGFRKPGNWLAVLGIAAFGTAGLHLLIGVIFKPIVIKLVGRPPDLSNFDAVRGNFPALLVGLGLVWTLAAFGEEMIFRGYYLNRLAEAGKKKKISWLGAALISSVIFGFGHTYQGEAGILLTGLAGLAFSAAYLLSKKNLWVPIIMHGLYDTSAFLILYFNLDL